MDGAEPIDRPSQIRSVHRLGNLAAGPANFMVERPFPPLLDLRSRKLQPVRAPEGVLDRSGIRGFVRARGLPDEAFVASDAFVTRSAVWLDGAPVAGTRSRWTAAPDTPEQETAGQIRQALEAGTVPLIEGRSAVIEKPGIANYYHWSAEILPRLNLLAPLLRAGTLDRVFVYGPSLPPAAQASIEWFFPDLADRLSGLSTPITRFESLLYFVNALESAESRPIRTCISTSSHQWMRSAIDRILERDHPSLSNLPARDCVLVSRNDARTRRILNEDDLLDRLGASRWRRLSCSNLSLAEQITAFRGARIVLGAHGAALANLMFCRPGTRVIELSGASFARFSHYYCDIADQRGLDYRLVLVDEELDPTHQRRATRHTGIDLRLAPAAIDRLIRLIDDP